MCRALLTEEVNGRRGGGREWRFAWRRITVPGPVTNRIIILGTSLETYSPEDVETAWRGAVCSARCSRRIASSTVVRSSFIAKPGRREVHLAVATAYRHIYSGFEALFVTAAAAQGRPAGNKRHQRQAPRTRRRVHRHFHLHRHRDRSRQPHDSQRRGVRWPLFPARAAFRLPEQRRLFQKPEAMSIS